MLEQTLQSYMYTMLRDSNQMAAKMSVVCTTLNDISYVVRFSKIYLIIARKKAAFSDLAKP